MKRNFRQNLSQQVETPTNEGEELRARLQRDEKGDPLLTESLIEALVLLITDGNTLENSARVCGLRRSVLDRWTKRGREDIEEGHPSDFGRLVRALDSALGDQEWGLARAVFSQSRQDPRLALETLGRRRPESWAPASAEPTDYRSAYAGMSLDDVKKEMKRLMEADKKETSNEGGN